MVHYEMNIIHNKVIPIQIVHLGPITIWLDLFCGGKKKKKGIRELGTQQQDLKTIKILSAMTISQRGLSSSPRGMGGVGNKNTQLLLNFHSSMETGHSCLQKLKPGLTFPDGSSSAHRSYLLFSVSTHPSCYENLNITKKKNTLLFFSTT